MILKAKRRYCPNEGCSFNTNSNKIIDMHLKKCKANTEEVTLDDYTINELRQMARDRGMTNVSTFRKVDLIEAMSKK